MLIELAIAIILILSIVFGYFADLIGPYIAPGIYMGGL